MPSRPSSRRLALAAYGCAALLGGPAPGAPPSPPPPPTLPASLTLAEAGVTAFRIMIPQAAAPFEKTAADELARYLGRITGATFPVVVEGSPGNMRLVISVGRTARFAEAFPAIDLTKLAADSIVQQTRDGSLFLAGQGSRGTLYAVHDFLETACGVRWWTPTEEAVPSRPNLAIAPPARVFQPPLSYREANSRLFTGTVLDHRLGVNAGEDERHRFAVRCKVNALAIGTIPPAWGGNLVFIVLAQDPTKPGPFREHNRFIDFREYGATHPEWFAERGGRRQTAALHLVQLCLSNEAMRRQFLEAAKRWLDDLPETMSFAILHNDNLNHCQCPDCAAFDEAEGSPMASQMRFMNFIAEELAAHRPGVEIWMDAYTFTVTPPKTLTPRDNLGIMLCTPIRSQRLADDATFLGHLEAWKRITPKVRVWDYVVNFDNLVNPWPNLRHLGPNIRLVTAHGAQGIFSQGNVWNSVGDAEELKTWVISHMLWDPDTDPDALIDEFVTGYYGPAATPVRAYLDLIVARGGGIPGGVKGRDANAWLDLAAMNRATDLLDEAGTLAAKDPTLEERVARLRMSIDNQWIWGWRQYRAEADATGGPFKGPDSPLAAVARFRKSVARFRCTHDREQFGYGTMETTLRRLEQVLTDIPGPSLPPPFTDVPPENRVHLQEDRLTAIDGKARVVADPLASNGKALKTSADHKDSNIQADAELFRLLSHVGGLAGRWRVFMDVRVDANKPAGEALQAGIYSYAAASMNTKKTVRIEDLQLGGYTRIDLGVLDLDQDSQTVCIWAGPLKNPDTIEAISVDRVILIRQ